MTKKQFENQLKQQAYAAVPDKLSDLMKTIAAENDRGVSLSGNGDEPHLVPVVPAHSSQNVGRWLALAACFAVVLCAVLVAATRGGDTQLTRGTGDPATTTTTALGVVPSASGSGETGGSQRGSTATVSAASQASSSASDGTNVTGTKNAATATGSLSGGTTVTGAVLGDTTKKGTTTFEKSGKKTGFWNDFSVDTTKGGNTTKLVPGGATTEKTVAPSTKPTTKRTTAPTEAPTCSHDVAYTPPVLINGRQNPNAKYCVEWLAYEPGQAEPSAHKEGPGDLPSKRGIEDDFTFTTTYGVAAGSEEDSLYAIVTEVKFADGWRFVYFSECVGSTVRYSTKCQYTNAGVCIYEEKYDPKTETLAIVERDRAGKVVYETSIKIPIGSPVFQRM